MVAVLCSLDKLTPTSRIYPCGEFGPSRMEQFSNSDHKPNFDNLPELKFHDVAAQSQLTMEEKSWAAEHVWSPVQRNVLNPMINGTGVVQIYNNFAPEEVAPLPVAESHNVVQSGVQIISEATGAIGVYVLAGKLVGCGSTRMAQTLGLTGRAATMVANESAAQIVGAGLYDFAKKPHQGETRLSNATSTMLSFAVFEGGNKLLGSKALGAAQLTGVQGVTARSIGRFGVGGIGGLTGYETSSAIAGLQGQNRETNWNDRLHAMAQGGFINTALPVVQKGALRAFDAGAQRWGKGVPVNRYMHYENLHDPELISAARENPLARVKEVDSGTRARIKENIVELKPGDKSSSSAKLAHELTHLRLSRQLEPYYKLLGHMTEANPATAEPQFYKLRMLAESQARAAENRVQQRMLGKDSPRVVEDPAALPDELASNGKSYREIWTDEWQSFKNDRTFRPIAEHRGSEPETFSPKAKVVSDEVLRDGKESGLSGLDQAFYGSPEPLGATITDKGVNFAVASQGASKVEVLIFDDPNASAPTRVMPLFKTDNTWHRFEPGMKAGTQYLYRAYGPYEPAKDGSRFNSKMGLIDPYSKAITGDTPGLPGYDNSDPNDPNRHLKPATTDSTTKMPRSIVVDNGSFDWKGDRPPAIPMTDTNIYEVNLRAFTVADKSLGDSAGTYLGLIDKIPHLKKLNVTAVELMPIMEFDYGDWPLKNPETGEPLGNSWGYNTVAFQAPEARFARTGSGGQQVNEFKTMVRELHKNGIEVILDVVLNHTREGSAYGPTISFKGLDNKVYYMLDPSAPDRYVDHTGCGNTLNCNNPQVQKLILDTLRYWKQEMHVDGFRFDLATIFNYDVDGMEKSKTPIIAAIESDPVLKDVKLIAEAWGPDQYRLGHFSDQRWSEWNGNYRDTARKFIKGDSGQLAALADRIAGSRGWFRPEAGRYSINFVTAHDGFTLEDLVSYQQKHNHGNGENNNDGSNDNFSWNHGVEGPVETADIPLADKLRIEQLRTQQIKNFLTLQYMSQGTPMMLYGDEMGRSALGNNNPWPQEKLNALDWNLEKTHADVLHFSQTITDLRSRYQVGRRGAESINWHGTEPNNPDFSDGGRFIAWQYGKAPGQPNTLYQAFNAYWEPLQVRLPEGNWRRLVDTSLEPGNDAVKLDQADHVGQFYTVQPRSAIVLQSDAN
jgi:isoamylase